MAAIPDIKIHPNGVCNIVMSWLEGELGKIGSKLGAVSENMAISNKIDRCKLILFADRIVHN